MTSKDYDGKEIFDALSGEDDLGSVIRAHILIEARLIELINLFLANPHYLDKIDLKYHQKVKLIIALGLNEEYETPLNVLGAIRNNYAHKPNHKLTKSQVDSLYQSFSGASKNIMQVAVQKASRVEKSHYKKSLRKNNLRDQFKFMAVAVDAMLQVAIRQKKESA